jgi:transposase
LNGRTHDYSRHGTTSLFAALDIKTGHVLGECHQHYCSIEFRKFLDQVDAATPAIFEIHIIMGNYATYKTPLMHRWLSRHPRYHIHFTPTGAAWLNLVERWFATLTEKQLRRGVHSRTRELEDVIYRYLEITNIQPKPFIWTKTADQILASIYRFCKRISDSGH